MNVVILSSPLLVKENQLVHKKPISLDEAKEWVIKNDPVNYSGHETVKIVGVEPAEDRPMCKEYDEALVLSPDERLEWGREYSIKEILEIGVSAYLLTSIPLGMLNAL